MGAIFNIYALCMKFMKLALTKSICRSFESRFRNFSPTIIYRL